MGILARTHKDLWMLSSTEEGVDYHLLQSLGFYLEGYESSGGYYTGINAASMALVAGETEKAEAIAREVSAICEESLAKAAPDSGEFYWLEATAAEAALVVGDLDTASKFYRKATTEHHPVQRRSAELGARHGSCCNTLVRTNANWTTVLRFLKSLCSPGTCSINHTAKSQVSRRDRERSPRGRRKGHPTPRHSGRLLFTRQRWRPVVCRVIAQAGRRNPHRSSVRHKDV